jgi:phage/plasmid-like protein (TIGR03299 family)
MAHELDFKSNGDAAIAFVGNRSQIWHGLGQELTQGASLETWRQQAGMDWEIKQTQVRFDNGDEMAAFPNQTVLYRGDTKAPLSQVSGDYKIVQPGEVLEFFKDMVDGVGMSLETAGVLYGGKRFWALANTNNASEIVKNDLVKGMLLLTSSCDGKMATTAQFTSVRVVCANTLKVALGADSGSRVRVTHSRVFDPMDIKSKMGLLEKSWDTFRIQMQELAKIKVTDTVASNIYYELVADPKKLAEDQSVSVGRDVSEMMTRYKRGMGSELTAGTAWGVLNGLTEFYDYSGRASADSKLWGSWNGKRGNAKDDGLEAILKKFDLVTV